MPIKVNLILPILIQINNSQIEHLTTLVKTLKEKNLNLELASKKARSDYKELSLKTNTCTAVMSKDNKDLKFVIKDLTEKLSKNEKELEISRKEQKRCFEILTQKNRPKLQLWKKQLLI